ncbi:MAG: LamG-like jellyroll fold domain-containing protein, partial [Bacteroidota bacterium]|nr:LamG-like jellyroll fold domain-containing protein [Bacteroidota bacterium]
MYSQKSIVFFLTLIFLSIFTYGQANLSSGLTAYYPLDGNARDYSGNSFDGNIYEATPTQDRFGNYNHAYSFDGNNDFIGLGNNFGDIFSNGNRQFAFSFWFKCNNLSGTNILIDKAASNVCSESQYEWVIRTKDSHLNFVAFYSLDGTNARNIECYKTLNTNTWYHVVGNFDGN